MGRGDWRAYLGIGALVAFVVWLRERTPASAPPSAEPARPERWVELDGPEVFLFMGDRYRACVNVPTLIPTSKVRSEILRRAPGLGFRSISVADGPPPGWPKATTPGGDCELFVEATWDGADGQRMARDGHITGAWRLARA